jgi:hypothetical protein
VGLYIIGDIVELFVARVKNSVSLEWGPEIMDYGLHEFVYKEPNGYFLAFAQVI